MDTLYRPHFFTPPGHPSQASRALPPLARAQTKSALRIAFVSETYPPEINGAARTVKQMVEGQLARGHLVHLSRPHQGAAETGQYPPRLKTLLLPSARLPRYPALRFGLPVRRTLVKAWRQFAPQLVYVATEGPLGLSALNAADSLGIPCIAGFHTNFHDYSTHFGLGRFKNAIGRYMRYFHNRCAHTIVPTQMLSNLLSSQGYHNLYVLPRGVDADTFSPLHRDRALRASWGLNEDDIAIIHVGRISPEKNIPLAVRTFEAISTHHPSARLVLVGDGPDAAALKVAHPDYIFCGMQTGAALSAHYASGDILLMPSITETFGNVVLEGMASELTVITYDYAAGQEHIQPGRNGLLAWFGDEDDFIRCALKAASERGSAREMARNARETAENLSWPRADERVEALFFECADTLQQAASA